MTPGPFRILFLVLQTLALPAQVIVRLAPRHVVLKTGEKCPFTVQGFNTDQVACVWSLTGEGGRLGPDGVFTGAEGLYRVRATSSAHPGVFTETSVLVLAEDPVLERILDLVRQIFGPEALGGGWSSEAPFMDFAGPGRFGDPRAVAKASHLPRPGHVQIIGYGLNVPVQWPWAVMTAGVQSALLSYLESGEPVRVDVTCCTQHEVRARGSLSRVQLEILTPEGEKASSSRIWPFAVSVRGLVPLAGHAAAGDADGVGAAARFRGPEGLALLESGEVVAADPQSHVLRLIQTDGRALTPWGSAGDPGHRDGAQAAARFRSPTFVAACPERDSSGCFESSFRSFVVADTGNHVIRAVDSQGRVTTLAGEPGQPGWVDSPSPRRARFNEPRGLAVAHGATYVADAGNHVIRRIDAKGRVTTLAGVAGQPGFRDGTGSGARFLELKGLVHAPSSKDPGGRLFVIDGHSVREITLEGRVFIICGDPRTAGVPAHGFTRDYLPLHGVPTLDHPHGIAALGTIGMGGFLVIADRGNHALLAIQLGGPDGAPMVRVEFVVGSPGEATTRFGLLRCSIPGPVGPDYAALDAPLGVAVVPFRGIFISDGPRIVHCSEPVHTPRTSPQVRPAADATAPGTPMEVAFTGPREDGAVPGQAHFFWTLDFLDPLTGDPVAARASGEVRGRIDGAAQVSFPETGEVDVHLTCLTADGVSATKIRRIRVE